MDLIVDGPSIFARNFYAAVAKGKDFGTFVPAEAVTLSMRTLLSLLNPDSNRIGYQFERMLVAWDLRQNPQKNREPKPPEYHEMRELFREVLTAAFQPAHAEHQDYEADDLVATAVYNSPNKVVVVSGDKDLMQLQSPDVHYYDLNQKALLSERFIAGKWHIKHPSQLAIALAIIGDPVDNIEGIPRWGPKRTQKLFEAVPREASFKDALEIIVAQIPEELQPAFWASLDRTLLNRDVPGVPEPAPIVLEEPDVIESLGLPIGDMYRQLWSVYTC